MRKLFTLVFISLSFVLVGCGTVKNIVPVENNVLPSPIIEQNNGETKVFLEKQPTILPGNYSENSDVLRKWAMDNKVILDIPEGTISGQIIFKMSRLSMYNYIPGNIQIAIDGKNICNGRLNIKGSMLNIENDTYTYELNHICTQDKPNCFSLLSGAGKNITFQGFIGENKNQIESIYIKRYK